MTMIEAVKHVFSNYVGFSGRAGRPEFWWWVLASLIIGSILTLIDINVLNSGAFEVSTAPGAFKFSVQAGILGGIWSLVTFLPALAVTVRRLHDTDRSGWWILLALLPVIGWVVLIYWYAKRGSEGANRFGSGPAVV